MKAVLNELWLDIVWNVLKDGEHGDAIKRIGWKLSVRHYAVHQRVVGNRYLLGDVRVDSNATLDVVTQRLKQDAV